MKDLLTSLLNCTKENSESTSANKILKRVCFFNEVNSILSLKKKNRFKFYVRLHIMMALSYFNQLCDIQLYKIFKISKHYVSYNIFNLLSFLYFVYKFSDKTVEKEIIVRSNNCFFPIILSTK